MTAAFAIQASRPSNTTRWFAFSCALQFNTVVAVVVPVDEIVLDADCDTVELPDDVNVELNELLSVDEAVDDTDEDSVEEGDVMSQP
jgi:hypothetical protein